MDDTYVATLTAIIGWCGCTCTSGQLSLACFLSYLHSWVGALIGVALVIRKANFASMSVDELWEIHEEISKLLEAKMLAEKKMLECRLISLHPAKDR